MNYKTLPETTFAPIEQAIGHVCAKTRSRGSRQDVVLMRLVTHLATGYHALVQRVIGPERLNPVMFMTLMLAFGAPEDEVNPSQLSATTGESRANMTRICDELCERGLIRRHAALTDRRRVVISLTAAGDRLVRKLLPELRRLLRAAHELVAEADVPVLEGLLKQQVCGLDRALAREEQAR